MSVTVKVRQLQRLVALLLVANAFLFAIILLGRVRPLAAQQSTGGVLRGSALEIVDKNGVVRFSVTMVEPGEEAGKHRPDRVLVRVGSPGAGPGVKLITSADGTTLGLMHNDRPLVQLTAAGNGSFVRLLDGDGRERIIKP